MKFDFEVIEIDKTLATNFVQKYHYSPVMPAITKHYLGFFLSGELKGVVTLGWGTKPRHTFNKMFPNVGILEKKDESFIHDINDWYYEIGKMCLTIDLNDTKGAGSQMVSSTIKWLKNNTTCQFLYTMADGIMGKCGFVYQASNFYYGEQYFTSVYLMENGEKLHPRTSKELCKENAKFSGKEKLFWMTTDFMEHRGIKRINGLMFRYLYPLNKKAKRMMLRESSMNWDKNYPKSKQLEWVDVTDMKNKKTLKERPSFTFENAKYNKNIPSTLDEFYN
jgi:hypothetical protein|tara:strand:+ start:89 stop:922 length:834 start_codon:yes stop_codon:yes gene_type:complete